MAHEGRAPESLRTFGPQKRAREVTSPMVHAPASLTRGARPHRPRRTIPPAVAEMLAAARRKHRWSIREAARRVNVAPGTIVHLEKARRAPSVIVAEDIIYGYRLGLAEADMLRAAAVADAGRSSPWRPPHL